MNSNIFTIFILVSNLAKKNLIISISHQFTSYNYKKLEKM